MIIVTGTGRSGTSTVARLLHERLGVRMGERFDPPSKSSPRGSYEDLDFRELHVAFQRGTVGLPGFRRGVELLVGERTEPWGFKDPRACHLLGLYLQWVSPIVIVCERPVEQVVASLHRHYHTPVEEARRETIDRLQQLEAVLRWYPRERRVWMGEQRDEEELVEELRAIIQEEGSGG